MGNSQTSEDKKAVSNGQKIILRLRYRDIILHYAFKMKLSIADIGIFPDHLQGLRLWDTDMVLSRFTILQNEHFSNQEVFVFKAGVGITGIALSKWGGCKSVTMCDTKEEVVANMKRNCERNDASKIDSVMVNLAEFGKYEKKFDRVLSSDLFGQGFMPEIILNIWRKLLKVGGEAFMIVPEKKDKIKELMAVIDREEFKINNLVLTAQEYEASPLFNKIESETEFPLLGKSSFYAVCLTKLKEKEIEEIIKEQEKQPIKEDSQQMPAIPQRRATRPVPIDEPQKQRNQKLGKKQERQEVEKKLSKPELEDNQPVQIPLSTIPKRVQAQAENEEAKDPSNDESSLVKSAEKEEQPQEKKEQPQEKKEQSQEEKEQSQEKEKQSQEKSDGQPKAQVEPVEPVAASEGQKKAQDEPNSE